MQYFTPPCEKLGSGRWCQAPKEMHTPEWPNVTLEWKQGFHLWEKVTAFSKSNESTFFKEASRSAGRNVFKKTGEWQRAYN